MRLLQYLWSARQLLPVQLFPVQLFPVHYLLPALLPSWRFFDDVGPSPRIEVALLRYASDTPQQWLPFPPVDAQVSVAGLLRRLCWNPRRNEALFLLSCSERVLQQTSRVAETEIVKRIHAALLSGELLSGELLSGERLLNELAAQELFRARCFVFRIRLVTRDGAALHWCDAFQSAPQPLPQPLTQQLLQQRLQQHLQQCSQQQPGDAT